MANEQGEKHAPPSARRLKDARERGQIPRSRDLGTAVASLTVTAVLMTTGPAIVSRLLSLIAEGVTRLGDKTTRSLTPEDMTSVVVNGGSMVAFVVGPIALLAAGAGVLTTVAQGGFNVAPKALRLDWSRLSPAHGIRRLAWKQGGVDTVKVVVLAAVLSVIGWNVCRDTLAESRLLLWTTPIAASRQSWQMVTRLLWQSGFALVSIGGFDYGLQRWRIRSSLKMSQQEVKDELRSNEGSPEIKARVRRLQRDAARRRMLHATKKATVVITNPTHFAVALQYRRESGAAPIVVAKGRDHIAARIREIAREHAVPIVENPPLARALHQGADVGDMIPTELFGAVAEVLAYLVRIKQLML
ncbi:MAG TPA: EscU/YscU/HrcU family type III secretion system export apparatus switch protein [Vicinamibacterales bacterium]|nr:EscU/YscU/HrcU family type III secretion system export apparatus switch protein [Vicinamibacterales bacterium]